MEDASAAIHLNIPNDKMSSTFGEGLPGNCRCSLVDEKVVKRDAVVSSVILA